VAKPVANFTGTPLIGSPPLSVGFSDTSTHTPDTWAWDFGDTGTSSSQNPTHIYSAAGSYTVVLTAANDDGTSTRRKTYYVTVGAVTPSEAPDGRFLIAFDDDTLEPVPAWTRIDAYPNLLTSYTIDRGRQYELDRTDVGRATVTITDPDGILDPTNPGGPYYNRIEPLLQAMIRRRNPVTGNWDTRYRGFVEEMDYGFDPSQKLNRLTVTLIDIFEILNAVKMMPGNFGFVPPPDESADQVWFEAENMDDRIKGVVGNSNIPPEFLVCFSGNVLLYQATYSPGESAMTAVQEAADAEFPGVSNVYTDRFGRLAVHGRLAKFDPASVIPTVSDGAWDWHEWHAGDGAAVHAAPSTTAHIRRFSMNRGLAKVINQALATPHRDLDAAEMAGQIVSDTSSINRFGIRSQEWQNLLTAQSLADGAADLVETGRFAEYYVTNYAQPQNRVTECGFRSMRPGQEGTAANWLLLQQVDVSDLVHITVASPGGGGLEDAQFYVEGVHETVTPLNPDYDNVDLSLDLSPVQYFADVTMWPT
jgi:PKD repeat protein